MKNINLLLVLAGMLLFATVLNADIYEWTDKNGVKYFSNQPPPDHAQNVKVIFEEYQYNATEDQKRIEVEEREWDTLMEEIKADEQRTEAESGSEQQGPGQNQQLSREERIQLEKERLENEIQDLEEKPVSYFGSFKNKRVRLGYYRYRLNTLMNDPDEYFRNPEAFEGNLKYSEDTPIPSEDQSPSSTDSSTN